MPKRLTSIRKGIRYQDLVAAEALLQMVNGEPNPPQCVRLEDRHGGSFDDVVIQYADITVWKQVKWAANPGREPLTIDSLKESKGRRRSLIKKFADSVAEVGFDDSEYRFELITNRSPDSEFRKMLSGRTSRLKIRLTKEQTSRLNVLRRETGLDAKLFKQFASKLSLLVNSPDAVVLEKSIRTQLRLLGCRESAFLTLLEQISKWSQDDSVQSISASDVSEILSQNFNTPPNDFHLPTVRVDRPDAQQALTRMIAETSSGYLVVLGRPGYGKSTLLNTIAEQVERVSAPCSVIVYNCFTGTSDGFLRTRARADNFAKFLARSLHNRFGRPGLTFDATSERIESLLTKVADALDHGEKLVIVVDGLDYAKRYAAENSDSLVENLPPNLPDNVVVVASAQVKEQLPAHLSTLPDSRFFHVPPLDCESVTKLLHHHGCFQTVSEDEQRKIGRAVIDISQGHPLLVSYMAKQISDCAEAYVDSLQFLQRMQPCSGDIEEYYRSIFCIPSESLARDALSLMASCPFELSPDEIAELMPSSVDSYRVEDALRPHSYLFQRINKKYYFCHDSLRHFATNAVDGPSLGADQQFSFLNQLEFDPRIGDHQLHLMAELSRDSDVDVLSCDWLAEQIASGASLVLLDEGLMFLAISLLERGDIRRSVRIWCLRSCLSKAEMEGLAEATLVDSWLAGKRSDLVERYLFVSSPFLSRVFPGPDILDLIEQHGESKLAEQLRSRMLSQPVPPLDPAGPSAGADDFASYVRHIGIRMPANELLPKLEERAAAIVRQQESRNPHGSGIQFSAAELVTDYIDKVVGECVYHNERERAEEWLFADECPLSDASWSENFLRLCLTQSDFSQTELVSNAIDAVECKATLRAMIDQQQFAESISAAIQDFHLTNLFAEHIPWYDRSAVENGVRDLVDDLSICLELEIQSRIDQIKSETSKLSCRLAREFARSTISLHTSLKTDPGNWRKSVDEFSESVGSLGRSKLSMDDVGAAQGFVGCLGFILRPVAELAKSNSEEDELAACIESRLNPALKKSRINYETGQISIIDLLHELGICRDLSTLLMDEIEDLMTEGIEFKSDGLIYLSSRRARAGDMEAANRALQSGVRAAFTYGYRKDTLINHLIHAFETTGPHLGDRYTEVAEFITRVIILLDSLTDGRMLYSTSSYFVALVYANDDALGGRLAQNLWESCRSLKPRQIYEAAVFRGLNVEELKDVFDVHAPSIVVETPAGEIDLERGFPDFDFFVETPTSFAELRLNLAKEIEHSGYGSSLYKLDGLIKSLVELGRIDEAVSVFSEFENAVQSLVRCYPLPDLT